MKMRGTLSSLAMDALSHFLALLAEGEDLGTVHGIK